MTDVSDSSMEILAGGGDVAWLHVKQPEGMDFNALALEPVYQFREIGHDAWHDADARRFNSAQADQYEETRILYRGIPHAYF